MVKKKVLNHCTLAFTSVKYIVCRKVKQLADGPEFLNSFHPSHPPALLVSPANPPTQQYGSLQQSAVFFISRESAVVCQESAVVC